MKSFLAPFTIYFVIFLLFALFLLFLLFVLPIIAGILLGIALALRNVWRSSQAARETEEDIYTLTHMIALPGLGRQKHGRPHPQHTGLLA